MADRGSITINGQKFAFAVIRFTSGLPSKPSLMTDQLEAGGVDGTLVGDNHYTFKPFALTAIISFASLASAQATAEALMGYEGRFASEFVTTVFGVSKRYTNVHVIASAARAYRDIGGGAYAVANQTAVCEVQLTLRATSGPTA